MAYRWVNVVGLGFGNEGKGSVVRWLSKVAKINLVVKYGGGPHSGTHIIEPNGKTLVFSTISPAMLSSVPTLVHSSQAVDLQALQAEALLLSALGVNDALSTVYISDESPLVLPFHRVVSLELEKLRGNAPIGISGFGTECIDQFINDTGAAPIMVKDVFSTSFVSKLTDLYSWACTKTSDTQINTAVFSDQTYLNYATDLQQLLISILDKISILSFEEMSNMIDQNFVVFQSAGGVLTDKYYGFYPYVTSNSIQHPSPKSIQGDLGINGATIYKLGVIRSYHHRIGYGPLPSARGAEKIPAWRHDKYLSLNPSNTGPEQIGEFERPLMTYAINIANPTGVIMTYLDHAEDVKLINEYTPQSPAAAKIIPITKVLGDQAFQNMITTSLLAAKSYENDTTMMDCLESGWISNIIKLEGVSWGPTYEEKKFAGQYTLAAHLGL